MFRLAGPVCLAFFALAQGANAALLTFNGPQAVQATYSESGVNVSINSGSMVQGFNYTTGAEGSLYWGDHGGRLITFNMGGAAFDLNSFEIWHNHGGDVITGSNGASMVLPDSCASICGVAMPIVFDAAWQGITWFTINSATHTIIDDLVLTASSVPEPSPLGLVALSLVGLAVVRQRR